jgi:O-antigen/teichoic acid export membrane protein
MNEFCFRAASALTSMAQGLKTKNGQDFSLTVVSNFGLTLIGAIGGILAARVMGLEGRGQLAAAIVWSAMLGAVVYLGIPQALTYFVARMSDSIGSIVATTIRIWFLQSLIALVLGWFAISCILAPLQPDAVNTVKIYLFSVPFTALQNYISSMMQGLRRFRALNILRTVYAIAYPLSILIGASGLHSATAVVSLLLLSQMLITLGSLNRFLAQITKHGSFEWKQLRLLMSYGIRSYGGDISWLANNRLDQFAMSGFLPLAQLGGYAVAVSYATMLMPLSGAFAAILFPDVARSQGIEAKSKIWRSFKLNLVILTIGAFMLAATSPYILPWLFGSEFRASIQPAIILLVGTILLGSVYVLSDALRGLGLPLVRSLAEIVGFCVTIIGLAIALPRYGIIGAATVSVLSYGTVAAILYTRLHHVLRGTEFKHTES